ncbi:helix-turn-helix domain-containing protein, partial [Burkholderia thailandensis]
MHGEPAPSAGHLRAVAGRSGPAGARGQGGHRHRASVREIRLGEARHALPDAGRLSVSLPPSKMNKFSDMSTLVAVVESGSFSEAARRLGTTKSIVSHRVQQLEKRL